jgi:hypothetical protein
MTTLSLEAAEIRIFCKKNYCRRTDVKKEATKYLPLTTFAQPLKPLEVLVFNKNSLVTDSTSPAFLNLG